MVGAGAEIVAGDLVQAMTYTVIKARQLPERSAIPVAQEQRGTLTPGAQTQAFRQVAERSQRKRYRSRIASTATKVNLDFEEAKSVLVDGLMKSLAGPF